MLLRARLPHVRHHAEPVEDHLAYCGASPATRPPCLNKFAQTFHVFADLVNIGRTICCSNEDAVLHMSRAAVQPSNR